MGLPILKWAGGKRKLVPEILKLFPEDYHLRTYHEPFFGGGALFFKMDPMESTINDINPDLINFYKVVQNDPDDLIEMASAFKYDKDAYFAIRTQFNNRKYPSSISISDEIYRAALFLYLNKTCFNGLFRVNSKGEFNVPFGKYKNPTIVNETRIMEAHTILQNTQIFNEDFDYVLDYTVRGDLVYFDPPYIPLTKTSSFTSYSSGKFGMRDHVRLTKLCTKLDEKGVMFVLSNSDTKLSRSLYKSFNIVSIEAARSINSRGDKRGKVGEILVTNIGHSKPTPVFQGYGRVPYA